MLVCVDAEVEAEVEAAADAVVVLLAVALLAVALLLRIATPLSAGLATSNGVLCRWWVGLWQR